MSGGNLNRNPIDIGRACMPLVRLLTQDGLSWADREKIADAIANNLRIYADHQAEAEHLRQGAACSHKNTQAIDPAHNNGETLGHGSPHYREMATFSPEKGLTTSSISGRI